jgi:hypothetical protein
MDSYPTITYAVLAGSILIVSVAISIISHLKRTLQRTQYKFLLSSIRRPKYISRWSGIEICMLLGYMAGNVICIAIGTPPLSVAGRRAADLALISMTLLCITPHLGFLTNLLRLSLTTVHRLHLSVGIVTCLLLVLHVVGTVGTGTPLNFGRSENIWALIVSSSRALLAAY